MFPRKFIELVWDYTASHFRKLCFSSYFSILNYLQVFKLNFRRWKFIAEADAGIVL
jgi:hypothetical protein